MGSSKHFGASQNWLTVLVFASAKSAPSDRELALAPQLQLVSHDWEGRAACRGLDPSLFFGPNRFEPKRERMARENAAKEICAACPVRHPCHDYAVTSGEAFGVWGGIGETERRAILEGTPVRRAG